MLAPIFVMRITIVICDLVVYLCVSFFAPTLGFCKNDGAKLPNRCNILMSFIQFWMQNAIVGCDRWGSLWVAPFPLGLTFWAFKSVHFADANPDSRLAILLGSPGAPRWSSAILNHDSRLAIWTAQTVILQMLITIVA